MLFLPEFRIINVYISNYISRRMHFFLMALEVGNIVEGTITGIAKFGAFVELPDNKVGLVHISEVADEYVSDVNDYLKVKDKVKVKVLTIDERGKIALSIKQAQPKEEKKPAFHGHDRQGRRDFHERGNFGGHENHHSYHKEEAPFRQEVEEFESSRPERRESRSFDRPFRGGRREAPASFEDKLSRFLKDSDERLLDLKRNVESKRGGRGARRSD